MASLNMTCKMLVYVKFAYLPMKVNGEWVWWRWILASEFQAGSRKPVYSIAGVFNKGTKLLDIVSSIKAAKNDSLP